MAKLYLIKNVNGVKLIKYFYSKDTRGDFSKIFSKDIFYKLGFKNIVVNVKNNKTHKHHVNNVLLNIFL